MRYSPFLTCQEASRLITAELDRELGALERLGLKMHLKICDACPIVVRQMAEIRRSIREIRDTSEH